MPGLRGSPSRHASARRLSCFPRARTPQREATAERHRSDQDRGAELRAGEGERAVSGTGVPHVLVQDVVILKAGVHRQSPRCQQARPLC